MAAWGAAVPEEWAPPDAGLLAGEALEELPEGAPQGSEPVLVPFAERDLPLEPAARFAVLFQRRPRWERSAMEPYLAALASSAGGQTVEALLLRHARASQPSPDAPLMFSAR
ncbi:sister chromatid cohesion protein DCC1 [Monoraphidium neglectum]|uniref:Sister chromatid cohesion protein DCC1 n=1 Tax=Monoraphidium neglectum TaxID=145388 RepID=A0A0D2KNP3_9CHLO|nr:sister chromatid cohesion protein DCC1 [Monoraphidium neglectum]KIY97258.1 sister chromatid cohesion protein DCC1 [Monoraphidium neglectum]|eukprot:XP_013896278.1 sister chromatid cohesion protein DCC1 [Monoraphidium neglectum]